jgi:hypothetical protein
MASKKHCDLCDDLIGKHEYGYNVYEDGIADEMDLCLSHLRSLQELLKTWKTQQQGGYINPERDWPQRKVGARP